MRGAAFIVSGLAALALVLATWPVALCGGSASCASACPASASCHEEGPELTAPDCCSTVTSDAPAALAPQPAQRPPAPTITASPAPLATSLPAVERATPSAPVGLRTFDRCTLYSALLI